MLRKLSVLFLLLALSSSIGLAQTLTYPAESTPNVFSNTNQFQLGTLLGPQTFATLPVGIDGTIVYCSDCQLTNPCQALGTGGFAQHIQGQWDCQAGGGGGGGGGTPCSVTNLALQYNAAGTFGCVSDFIASGHAIVGGPSGVLNLSAMSSVNGFSIPTATSALPTGDGFLAFNSQFHTAVFGSNGNTLVFAVAGIGSNTNTNCSNQVITAISGIAAPTCSPLTGSYLPVPTVSSLGGVESIICPGGLFLNAISTLGVPICNTPAGSGNVSAIGTPTNGQIAQWTSATTIQGIGTTGTGNAVLANTPTLANPVLGVATATSLNNVIFTPPVTSATFTFPVDNSTFTMQGTDTYVGRATTDVLTHKTYDTAGTGNVFKINGVGISTVTGTGAAVLATNPTLIGPTLGAALATSINGLAITTSTGTLVVTNGKTFTISNSLTLAGTDATTQTFPTVSGTVVTSASSAAGDLGGNYPAPTVNAINLASSAHGGVFGTLPVANGGTGAASLSAAHIPVLNASNTFTAGTQDFSGVTQLKLPVGAGFATLANGEAGYDLTGNNWHLWQNGADVIGANFSGSITTGHCPQISVVSSVVTLVDSGSSNCGGGGSIAWSAIGNAAGALTLANGTNPSTFNHTSAVNWTWANTTAATLTVPQSSPILNLNGTYWTGAASAVDGWSVQDVVTAGTNGASTLTWLHTGSTGPLAVAFPGGVAAGVSGGAAGVITIPEGTVASGVAASDLIYAGTSSTHRLTMNNNNAGARLVVGIASAGTAGNCPQLAANGIDLVDSGAVCGGGGSGVTSVAQTFTGGLISVSGSPIITTGTLALTVAGISGGIPYFSSASTWNTSGAMTTGQFMLGGGAGSAPTTTFSIVPVANGGTNLASGTSGGILAYTATGVLASSAALPVGDFVLGGGAGAVPTATFSVVPVANGGTNLASGTSGGILGYTASGVLASSAALTANALVKGGGAGATPTSGDIQDVSNALSSTTTTQAVIYQGGSDASANSVLGGVTLRGANETGAGGATSAGGVVLITGGTNAATNAASQGGSVMILPGASTGATQGRQGLNVQAAVYVKGVTSTQWNLQCETAAMTVGDCPAGPDNWLGVAEVVNTNTVQMVFDGQTPVNASAAVTLGDTVCAGSTAGNVTDSGGTSTCTNTQGSTVGIVMATAGTWKLPDGTSFTATTTLPLIQMNPAAVIPAGGGSTAFSALTGSTNTTAAMICGTGCSLTVSGTGTNNATSVNGNTFPASAGFTSGGIPFFSSTSAVGSSALLVNHAAMFGGGAGATPTTDSNITTDGSGNLSAASITTSGATAGFFECTQGPANGHAVANTITMECPAAVTRYELLLPTAPASGISHWTNASGVVTESISAVSLTADISGILPVANGGTNLASGTSGGILGYTATGTLASSAALGAGKVVIGGGAGATPTAIDHPDKKEFPAANCVSTLAGSAWNTTLTPACIAGTNNLGGQLPFVDASTAQVETELPLDWDTTSQPFVNVFFNSFANTTGTVIFNVAVACTKADGSVTADPAFNTADALATKTMAAATRSWSTSVQLTQVTSGNNCVPGGTIIMKLTRATDTAGSAVQFTKMEVTTPRLIAVQAN